MSRLVTPEVISYKTKINNTVSSPRYTGASPHSQDPEKQSFQSTKQLTEVLNIREQASVHSHRAPSHS